ncbi:transmembrane 4 L6 family member 5 isoform X2 [Rhineura floridana]|uniref:transmembrane 4 L6 family member 5 isoform X2 n=1 Tax=Rhineura floridana TaxID=261503 RepID=UPI002AC82FE1|nr:transmembrane 4 L6 family member 5 isoform X2 [Rhineura floridana]
MCTGKCSRLVGLSLVAMSLACIVANLLLMFPYAELGWKPDQITLQVWLMGGLIGGGLMMLRSVFCSVFGGLGGFYCLVVSSTGLANGPMCETKDGSWGSPFKNLSENYLGNRALWEECVKPPNVVLWNVVLFSIQLGLGLLELVLCSVQVVNGLLGTVCGDCRRAEDRAGEGL